MIEDVRGVIVIPEELAEKDGKLDRYYIPTRYPNVWPALHPHKHYGKGDAEEALATAVEVVELVKREVEGDP